MHIKYSLQSFVVRQIITSTCWWQNIVSWIKVWRSSLWLTMDSWFMYNAELLKDEDVRAHICTIFFLKICAKFVFLSAKQEEKNAFFYDCGTIWQFVSKLYVFSFNFRPIPLRKIVRYKIWLRKRIWVLNVWYNAINKYTCQPLILLTYQRFALGCLGYI